jgi:superfamily II DNA or RNA helicase
LIILRFDKGNIVAEGGPVPYSKYDKRKDLYSAPGYRYKAIKKHLKKQGINYKDETKKLASISNLVSKITLRDYQEKALSDWKKAGNKGIVILPTGAGKTVLAMKAIENLSVPSLIVVPTIVLLDQWKNRLEDEFKIKIGALGGGKIDIRPITVTTYDSASIRADTIGNNFEFVVFDEVHHLPAPSYRRIGLMYTAPYRLGLTATLDRERGTHISLIDIVGRIVHEVDVEKLVGVHLSDFTREEVSRLGVLKTTRNSC